MEPVREQILNLQHISYTYHTLQGETLALSDIFIFIEKRRICRHCRSLRVWQIYTAFADLRTAALYRGAD